MSACGTENKITELKVIIWWNISNGTMDPRHWVFFTLLSSLSSLSHQLASEPGSNFTLVLFGNWWEHITTLTNSCYNSMFKLWQFHITPLTSIMQTPSWLGFATSNRIATAQQQHSISMATEQQRHSKSIQQRRPSMKWPAAKNWISTFWPYLKMKQFLN